MKGPHEPRRRIEEAVNTVRRRAGGLFCLETETFRVLFNAARHSLRTSENRSRYPGRTDDCRLHPLDLRRNLHPRSETFRSFGAGLRKADHRQALNLMRRDFQAEFKGERASKRLAARGGIGLQGSTGAGIAWPRVNSPAAE